MREVYPCSEVVLSIGSELDHILVELTPKQKWGYEVTQDGRYKIMRHNVVVYLSSQKFKEIFRGIKWE